jgi:hypothetical protein
VSGKGDVFSFNSFRDPIFRKTLVYVHVFQCTYGGARSPRTRTCVHVFSNPAEKEPQVRQMAPPGAGHQAEHTHRHQTAVFRSGETCPEAGSKRTLPSDKPGALPSENGFPLNNVRVRGQADPYTQRKRDCAPCGTE